MISSNINRREEPQAIIISSPEKQEEMVRDKLEDDESDVRLGQEDLLEGVDTFNFEGVNWRKEKGKVEDHSLKFSKSNIKSTPNLM